ncbi:MAG: class I SAM-dependent DNA methyltransferase, partial [archaeon]|nr:class I SAM-dependent DNA methyltransferase [archaeon]
MTQQKLMSSAITREELNSLVDKAADIIRTATDYKFILVLLFLKRVSDTWKEEFEQKKQDLLKYLDESKATKEAENAVYHTFNLKKDLLWDEMTKDNKKLPENLSEALRKIADLNTELRGVIDRISFLDFARQENREKLRQLVELFNQFVFDNKHVSSDIIGDAYEHILYRFAPTQAREGEVYTPREIIQVLVRILDPKPNWSICDPCCGSGGMLIESAKHVKEKYHKEKVLLYGQELSADIYGLCRLNLIAHGIADAQVQQGDSLLYPKFAEKGKLEQFDIILANPPWNQDGYAEQTLKTGEFRDRFSFGYSPQSSADWAWAQLMLASLKDGEGRKVGLVIDNGCLFRGGSEKDIRSKVVQKDWIECVILTPDKLFYNTGAAGALIIFNKGKSKERKNKILFINASKEYAPHPFVRRLNTFSSENIEKIESAYERFSASDGFSKVVDLKEVEKNDYNLTVTLYVMPNQKSDFIDIPKEFAELKELETRRQE